jgi:hypothetical protein
LKLLDNENEAIRFAESSSDLDDGDDICDGLGPKI